MNNNLFETVIRKTRQLIHSERFIHKHRIRTGFTRNRKLSSSQLIYFILTSGKKSVGANWFDISHEFPSLNLPSVSKQTISKARQKISSNACLELCQLFSKIFYKYDDAFSLWNGYHIYTVDGSTIQLESFSGYKPEIIKQDFYSTVFLSNLSALIKNMTDTHLKSNVQNKHKYQVNRNFIIGRVKRNIISFLTRKRNTVSGMISKIIKEAVRNLSLIRPGRQYPRHKKYTRRKCYMNDKYQAQTSPLPVIFYLLASE